MLSKTLHISPRNLLNVNRIWQQITLTGTKEYIEDTVNDLAKVNFIKGYEILSLQPIDSKGRFGRKLKYALGKDK